MSYLAKDSINWACAKAEFVLSYLELWKIFPILTHWTHSNHTPATSGVHPLSKRLASTSSLVQGKSYWKHIWPQLSHQFTFTCSTCKLTSGMNTTMSWSRWSSQQQMVFDTAGPERLYLKLCIISLLSFYTLWPHLFLSGATVTMALQSPQDQIYSQPAGHCLVLTSRWFCSHWGMSAHEAGSWCKHCMVHQCNTRLAVPRTRQCLQGRRKLSLQAHSSSACSSTSS